MQSPSSTEVWIASNKLLVYICTTHMHSSWDAFPSWQGVTVTLLIRFSHIRQHIKQNRLFPNIGTLFLLSLILFIKLQSLSSYIWYLYTKTHLFPFESRTSFCQDFLLFSSEVRTENRVSEQTCLGKGKGAVSITVSQNRWKLPAAFASPLFIYCKLSLCQ